jgi:hypothetical protein
VIGNHDTFITEESSGVRTEANGEVDNECDSDKIVMMEIRKRR